MFSKDADSERATSIEDYQNTCTNFIIDLSKDYRDWVDRYKLGKEEELLRKKNIDEIVEKTNDFMVRFGDTIKKIDIIMNDGINKMAESTAGYPFKIDMTVNNQGRYIIHDKGHVKLKLQAFPREGRQIRVSNYDKTNVFLFSSSTPIEFNYSKKSFEESDLVDDFIVIKPVSFNNTDVLSVTIKVEEVKDKGVTDSRGYTTLIVLK